VTKLLSSLLSDSRELFSSHADKSLELCSQTVKFVCDNTTRAESVAAAMLALQNERQHEIVTWSKLSLQRAQDGLQDVQSNLKQVDEVCSSLISKGSSRVSVSDQEVTLATQQLEVPLLQVTQSIGQCAQQIQLNRDQLVNSSTDLSVHLTEDLKMMSQHNISLVSEVRLGQADMNHDQSVLATNHHQIVEKLLIESKTHQDNIHATKENYPGETPVMHSSPPLVLVATREHEVIRKEVVAQLLHDNQWMLNINDITSNVFE
jgi:hypothetical protein